jgi:hypothetical protein
MKVNPWIAAILACGFAAATLPAVAQDAPVGQVKTARGKAELLRGAERLAAKPGDPVQAKDVIETGPDGAIGVTLIDNTVLSAGPNSQIALEEYSFNSSNFAGAMTADVRKGSLAVVTGDIARTSPEAMKVRTPTAILGVRGTQFAVQVGGQ